MVSWLGVIGSRWMWAIARIANRLTQAWNRVVNTLVLHADAIGVEPRQRLLVDLNDLVDHAVPGVRDGRGVSLGAESRAQPGVVGEQVDGRGQAYSVVLANQDAVAAGTDDLAEAGDVGGDHRQTGRHRLQQDN